MKIRAVLFDWAGTTIDYGSRAPTSVFVETFRREGVQITEAEARGPMGMAKRDHIATVVKMSRVAEAWVAKHGRPASDADVERLYLDFLPLQKAVLAQHCDVIPGVVEAVAELRRHGIRIGSTTGYTRELMDVVEPIAAANGYKPDVTICSDEVAAGRPAPWSNFRAAEKLGVYPMSRVVVVDDTPAGIEAGRHAGMFTIGVTMSGNALGLDRASAEALPAEELARRLKQIESDFVAAGANACLRSSADLPAFLAERGWL
jgi:phosphonoacetaldehyde hydrolase